MAAANLQVVHRLPPLPSGFPFCGVPRGFHVRNRPDMSTMLPPVDLNAYSARRCGWSLWIDGVPFGAMWV